MRWVGRCSSGVCHRGWPRCQTLEGSMAGREPVTAKRAGPKPLPEPKPLVVKVKPAAEELFFDHRPLPGDA